MVTSYTIVAPHLIYLQLKDSVQNTASPLSSSFQSLSKSTEFPLITSQEISDEIKKDNAEQISQLIASTRQQIGELKKVFNNYEIFPYSDMFGQYKKARFLEFRTQSFIGQTEDALDGYEVFYKYSVTYDRAFGEVTKELNSFNEVSDINIYSGQDERIRQVAGIIRSNAVLLSNTSCPDDMKGVNNAAIIAFNEAATGFEELADGLMIPADNPIYVAARKIEDATIELDTISGVVYDESMNRSRTLRNIQDLNDKLEPLLDSR